MGQTRFCRLGDLRPASPNRSNAAQTEAVFAMMDHALRQIGMDFSHVIRTWFFNDDILAWYGEFNQVRTHFFKIHHVFEGLVPASTGIGGSNPAGTALVSGLLAAQPCTEDVKIRALPSPMQCPALDYGSSFSRAVEMETPSLRRIWISGTASIDQDGSTIFTGDMTKQIEWTTEVVATILHSRRMTWKNVVRGVVYIRNQADLLHYSQWAQDVHFPPIPVVITQNMICRDDLLFEIELDAVSILKK
jgi:enamine deaminase RidA (YjgF/YER057c/UK114 family)